MLDAQLDRRRKEKAARRARIENAARDVFAQEGIEHATMDDVAKRAGVSKGALYLHFESKDELYLSLAICSMQELLVELRALSSEGSGFTRLERLMHTYARLSVDDVVRLRMALTWVMPDISVSGSSEVVQQYRALVEEVLGHAMEIIVTGQRDGSIRETLNPVGILFHFWGGLLGVLLLRLKAKESSQPYAPQFDPAVWDRISGGTQTAPEMSALVPSFIQLILAGIRP